METLRAARAARDAYIDNLNADPAESLANLGADSAVAGLLGRIGEQEEEEENAASPNARSRSPSPERSSRSPVHAVGSATSARIAASVQARDLPISVPPPIPPRNALEVSPVSRVKKSPSPPRVLKPVQQNLVQNKGSFLKGTHSVEHYMMLSSDERALLCKT